MRLVIGALAEEGLVRGDERERVAVGEVDQLGLDRPILVEAVALDLDIEPVSEGHLEEAQPRLRKVAPAGDADCGVERPARPAGERDQSAAMLRERRRRDPRRVAQRHVEIGPARERHEVGIALRALGEEHDVGDRVRRTTGARVDLLELHRELHPGHRLDAHAGELLGEFERAEEVVGVGERERRLPVGRGELGEIADLQGAFEERVGRVHMQVHEAHLLQDLRHAALR